VGFGVGPPRFRGEGKSRAESTVGRQITATPTKKGKKVLPPSVQKKKKWRRKQEKPRAEVPSAITEKVRNDLVGHNRIRKTEWKSHQGKLTQTGPSA